MSIDKIGERAIRIGGKSSDLREDFKVISILYDDVNNEVIIRVLRRVEEQLHNPSSSAETLIKEERVKV